MSRTWLLAIGCFAFLTATTLSAQGEKDKRRTVTVTMIGCLDEKPGPQYVLRKEGSLDQIAELQAGSFATEGFAKYLGHKVKIRGRSVGSGGAQRVSVNSIETVSEACTRPQQGK